jgi:hypothetical protein
METEALILRARAEHAKLAALYAQDEQERRLLECTARAYETQAIALEEVIERALARGEAPPPFRRPQLLPLVPANDNRQRELARMTPA